MSVIGKGPGEMSAQLAQTGEHEESWETRSWVREMCSSELVFDAAVLGAGKVRQQSLQHCCPRPLHLPLVEHLHAGILLLATLCGSLEASQRRTQSGSLPESTVDIHGYFNRAT